MAKENNIVEFPASPEGVEPNMPVSTPIPALVEEPAPDYRKEGPGIALALGGGAARGWAHIGVLRAIDEAQIPISMIAGTSIGALVGGCYLAGKLDELEEFARSITRWNVLRYMDFAVRASGLISGRRLADRMDDEIGDMNIEDLDRKFVAIATDIVSGSEIWLEHGSMAQAIRASYALPGVFRPVEHFERQLVDGALVNPVPVSACRAFEEELVIAVNLNSEIFGRASVVRSQTLSNKQTCKQFEKADEEISKSWIPFIKGQSEARQSRLGVAGVMIEAFNIIQDRISRSRLAGDPPDYTIRPTLTGIGLSDFHKADEAISQGYEVARVKLGALKESLNERML